MLLYIYGLHEEGYNLLLWGPFIDIITNDEFLGH
jgi:hypothetical protein